MKYARLIARCSKFNKLAAREDQLSYLLKQALAGDRDSYLVFLDLLTEENPEARSYITRTSDLGVILQGLANVCPDVIDEDGGEYNFLTPNFLNIKAIDMANTSDEIKYDDFSYFNSKTSSSRTIIFTSSLNVNDGENDVDIKGMKREKNRPNTIITNIIYGSGYTNDFISSELDEKLYKSLDEIFNRCEEKAMSDWSKLRGFLAIG